MAKAKNIREDVLKLKQEQPELSFDKIAKILGCSYNTVSYHLNPTSREKFLLRNKQQKDKKPFSRRILAFFEREIIEDRKVYLPVSQLKVPTLEHTVRTRVDRMQLNDMAREKGLYHTVLEKIQKDPKCYLTGKTIDLYNDVWELDHITPKACGGENTLENLGLTLRDANQAKKDMVLEDFVNLCVDVTRNFGYVVTKKET